MVGRLTTLVCTKTGTTYTLSDGLLSRQSDSPEEDFTNVSALLDGPLAVGKPFVCFVAMKGGTRRYLTSDVVSIEVHPD